MRTINLPFIGKLVFVGKNEKLVPYKDLETSLTARIKELEAELADERSTIVTIQCQCMSRRKQNESSD